MNVTTEQKENCVIDLHITLPPERFEQEWKRIVGEYCRLARIPGFRKGKAPTAAVEKKYAKEIKQEATDLLIKSGVQEALKEKKLTLAQYPEVRDVDLKADNSLHLIATIITEPEVELSEYKGLQLSVERALADAEAVEGYLAKVREDFADFINAEGRGLEMGDFAVLDYQGTVEGQSLKECYPDLQPSFAGRQHAWLRMEKKCPLPGFSEALMGLQPKESRDVVVTFPKDFSEEKLRDVTVSYAVTLHEIKERQLLPLDDAFAAKLKPGLTLEALREEIRERLQHSMDQGFRQKTQAALVEQLLKQTPCEPPVALVQRETAALVKSIIRDNQERGVPEEMIRSHQAELMASAQQSAEEKVKLHFILNAIAAKENITVTSNEFAAQIEMLSKRYQMSVEKLLKELKKNNALGGIQEEMIIGKTLEWLVSEAQITELPASPMKHDDGEHVHGPGCNHDH